MALQSLTITFPVQYYASGKYVQFVLDVDYNNYTNLVPYNASKYDLKILKYGSTKLQFNIDDYFLVPSNFSITLGDAHNNFENILFPDEDSDLELTGKLYLNGVLEFEGKHIPEKLSYNSNRDINIEFKSNTDILNETFLLDSAGAEKNPLNLLDGVTNSSSFKTAVHNAYKFIDPNIELYFNHNWIFYGDTHYVNQTNYQISDGTFDELRTQKSSFYSGENLADTLKYNAKKKFAFTGCVNNKKAFFQRLYYYNFSNLQTINVLAYNRGIALPNLTYAASKNLSGGIIHELPDADAYNTISGKSMEMTLDIEIGQNYNGWIYRSGKYYYIEKIKDPLLSSDFYLIGYLLPELHYFYRRKAIFNRLDKFTADGLEVDYLKNFIYNNRKYQILSMEKVISEGVTLIEALYLGVNS